MTSEEDRLEQRETVRSTTTLTGAGSIGQEVGWPLFQRWGQAFYRPLEIPGQPFLPQAALPKHALISDAVIVCRRTAVGQARCPVGQSD